MDSNKLANWLQVGANIGLLGGLVLVAIQISQSNAIATSSAGSVYFQQYQDYLVAGMGENPAVVRAKAIFEPDSPTAQSAVS